jgi:hypothetical protein
MSFSPVEVEPPSTDCSTAVEIQSLEVEISLPESVTAENPYHDRDKQDSGNQVFQDPEVGLDYDGTAAMQRNDDVAMIMADTTSAQPMEGITQSTSDLMPGGEKAVDATLVSFDLSIFSTDDCKFGEDGGSSQANMYPRGLYHLVKLSREEQNAAMVPKLHAPRSEYHRLCSDVLPGSSQGHATSINFKGLDSHLRLRVVGVPGPSSLVQEYLISKASPRCYCHFKEVCSLTCTFKRVTVYVQKQQYHEGSIWVPLCLKSLFCMSYAIENDR